VIFGVDLGTRRIAIACPSTMFVWAVSLERAADRREFRSEVEAGSELGRRAVTAIFEHHGRSVPKSPWLFVAERPFLRTTRPNVQTLAGMALSAGAALSQLPGRVDLLKHPSLWKKALCDNGGANKDEVRRTVTEREPTLATLCGEDENCFDAVGIALARAVLAPDGRM
jgi:Holliday junction resolvasome RuvABC endonuclease subunit